MLRNICVCSGCFTQVSEPWPVSLLSFLSWFVEIPELNENSVDPDQMSHSACT